MQDCSDSTDSLQTLNTPAPVVAKAEFEFLHSGVVLTRFSLPPGHYIAGRLKGCKILIDIDGIEPMHAALTIGQGVKVMDLNSTAGTFLKGSRLTGSAPLVLGDEFDLGTGGTLRLAEIALQPEPAPAPPEKKPRRPRAKKSADAPTPKRKAARKKPAIATADQGEPAPAPAEEKPAAKKAQPRKPRAKTPAKARKPKPAATEAIAEPEPVAPHPAAPEIPEPEKAPIESATPEAQELPKVSTFVSEARLASETRAARLSEQTVRLRKALVTEMERRCRAETRFAALRERFAEVGSKLVASVTPAAEPAATTAKRPARWRPLAATIAAVAIWTTTGLVWRHQHDERLQDAASTLRILQPAAEQFLQEAEAFIEAGDFSAAERQLGFALALAPNNSSLHTRLGDVRQTQCDFAGALASYREAVRLDSSDVAASDGLVVCERLVRAGEKHDQPTSNALYTIHRAMMARGRLAEAVRVAARLPKDANLQQRTWQERLRRGGLDATVQLNADHRLTVAIRGRAQTAFRLVSGMPAVAMDLSGTDVIDLAPLAHLPLESLDLSGTPVSRLEPLRDVPLRRLRLSMTQVEDLMPLLNAKIEELDISNTAVRSLGAMRNWPLRKLFLRLTRIADLHPLATTPLVELDASNTPVSDLSPLAHLPLAVLRLDDTGVTDLSALQGAQLRELSLARTPIHDVRPLARSPITVLSLAGCDQVRDLRPLAGVRSLQNFKRPLHVDLKEIGSLLPTVRLVE
jgi:tetratricopeptide (TPR) repeat protein